MPNANGQRNLNNRDPGAGERSAAARNAGKRETPGAIDGYLTTTGLGRLCGVSRFTIRNWINEGKIRAVRTVGGHWRIPVGEAATFLEAFQEDGLCNV